MNQPLFQIQSPRGIWPLPGIFNRRFLVLIAGTILFLASGSESWAQMYLRDICRVKGQEETQLHGLGLVIGLTGTGGGDRASLEALARSMELMGMPVRGPDGKSGSLLDLKDIKNVALVQVTATIPESGSRRGDKLNCTLSSYNASSLKGGQLVFAALQGPNLQDPRIVAFCDGRIQLDDEQGAPNLGTVFDGCQMTEDFFNPFHENDRFTLVLDKHHAGFEFADEVAKTINDIHMSDRRQATNANRGVIQENEVARARDALSIEVKIPAQYREQQVDFVAQVLGTRITEIQGEARVTINQRTGIITIDGDVQIGSVVISHKNLQIKSGDNAMPETYRPLELRDAMQKNASPRLEALISAFNALGVSGQDRIDIIKQLHRNGNLHAKLIIE